MTTRYDTAARVLRDAADARTRAARRAAGVLTEELATGEESDPRKGAVAIYRMLAEADELVLVADELDAQATTVAGDPSAAAAADPPAPTTDAELGDDATDAELARLDAKAVVRWVTAHPGHAARVRTIEDARTKPRATVLKVLDTIAPPATDPAPVDELAEARARAAGVIDAIDADPSLDAEGALDAAEDALDPDAPPMLADPEPPTAEHPLTGATDEDDPTDEDLVDAELALAGAPSLAELRTMTTEELIAIADGTDLGATPDTGKGPELPGGTTPPALVDAAAAIVADRMTPA
jgi:hypothetical protein